MLSIVLQSLVLLSTASTFHVLALNTPQHQPSASASGVLGVGQIVSNSNSNSKSHSRGDSQTPPPLQVVHPDMVSAIEDPLGPPHVIHTLEVGGDPLLGYRSGGSDDDGPFRVHRLAHNPPIFLLRNFLSPAECRDIRNRCGAALQSGRDDCEENESHTGTERNMSPAETTQGDGSILRRHCHVAWLDNKSSNNNKDDSPSSANLIQDLGRDAGNLLLSDAVKTCPNAGCEPLQVLRYSEQGGEFVLHHDGVGRVLTVIYYLNGVAGTWFPLADKYHDKVLPVGCSHPLPQDRNEALEIAKDCVPGRDGMLIAGRRSPLLQDACAANTAVVDAGDCVAFYNYHLQQHEQDGLQQDQQQQQPQGEAANWLSLHAGLPTTEQEGEKWIANHWMHAPGLFQNIKTHFSA